MESLEIASHVLLWIAVVVEGVLLLALARQIGLLHDRFAGTGARIMNVGPAIGEPAPEVDVTDVEGRRVTLATERGKRTLLLFISTGCSTCASMMPRLMKLARAESDNLEVKLIAFGVDQETGKKYAAEHNLDSLIPLAVSDNLALRYKVTLAPYGILIDRSAILRSK